MRHIAFERRKQFMRDATHSRALPRTSFLPLALLLVASGSSVLAQGSRIRTPRIGDRIGANSTIGALLKPFQSVQVTPLAAGAILSFDTRDAVNPIVRIGKSAPTQQPGGRTAQMQWVFNPGDEVPAFSAPRPQNPGSTTHRLRLQSVLAPNTTYFYILEAVSGGQLIQETGSFATISRRVKVVFQKIRVLQGGDGEGTGDLMFQFFLNYDATTNRNFVWLGGRETTLQIPNGQSINAGKEFTLNNVDELHLVVNGYDEDFLRVGAPPSSGADNSVQVPYPLNGAGHNNAGAWNVAKGDFDLSASPPGARAIVVPFSLTSLPIPGTGSGQDVAFEISGTYTISPSLSRLGTSIGDTIKNHGAIFGTPVPAPQPPNPPPGGGQVGSAIRQRLQRIHPQQ